MISFLYNQDIRIIKDHKMSDEDYEKIPIQNFSVNEWRIACKYGTIIDDSRLHYVFWSGAKICRVNII